MPNVLLVGNGAREHALAEAIVRSKYQPRLFAFMKAKNPGIASLSAAIELGSYSDLTAIAAFAKNNKIDFAVIGPEEPLNNGVVDALEQIGVPAVGPNKSLARLETSKAFTRNLVDKYQIPGNPLFKIFTDLNGLEAFLDKLEGIVLKPDGLTGGKGVLVQGDHFETRQEALQWCTQILKDRNSTERNFHCSACATAKPLSAPPWFRIIRGASTETAAPTRAAWDPIPCPITLCLF